MREFIARNFTFPLQDLLRGTNIRKEYESLLHSEKQPTEYLEKLQFSKLKNLVKFSNENIPYYNELFKHNNFNPTDLKSLSDISKIPITTKEMARDAGDKLFTSKKNKSRIKYGKTGGTTGMPLFYQKNTKTRSVGWGAYYRWYHWLGLKREDPKVSLWGMPTVIDNTRFKEYYQSLKYEFSNTLFINSFKINKKTLPRIAKKIARRKPKILHGYLSALIQLAHYLEDNQIDDINPIAIMPTTETVLPPYRELLERVFRSEVFDQYGCGECGSIAFECPEHTGLHIASEHCVVETINNDENGVGEVVITDLDNYAMPFLRYSNGDKAVLSDEKCPCSRPFPLIKKVLGRTADTIILVDGSKVHGVFFTDIIGELNFIENKKIRKFQAYQSNPGELEFRIQGFRLDNQNEKSLSKVLNRYFSKVKITYFEKIPNDESGKFRYAISEIQDVPE